MKLAPIFTDNLVFAVNKPVAIFGEGKGQIKIEFLGKTYAKTCNENKWVIYLDAFNYGGPYEMKIDLNGEIIVLKDIMVGEVVLCAGQSNMQFTLEEEAGFDKVKPNANVRCFVSDRIEEYEGLHTKDGWAKAEGNNLKYISALGFHIADEIAREKNIAVGIVGVYQGASTIRSWLDKSSLTKDVFVPEEERQVYGQVEYESWNGDSQLYEYTFKPITPYAFNSIVWYQGESNSKIGEVKVYGELLERLIYRFRKDLNDLGIPFVIVQICDYIARDDEAWRAIQKSQVEVAKKTQNAYLVTSSDVCAHENIHPDDKRKLALKIAKILI